MEDRSIMGKEFLSIYTVVTIMDFTIPFFLPSKVLGPYLFWVILTIFTIIYGILRS